MNLNVTDKQILLEEKNIEQRAKKTLEKLLEELQMLEMKNEIQSKVKTDLDKQQREYFLNQQLKTIKEELGSSSEIKSFAESIRISCISVECILSCKESSAFISMSEKLTPLIPLHAQFTT